MGYTKVLKEINGQLFESCGEIMVTQYHDNFAFVCHHCEEANIFMELVDFINHMQSEHYSCLEVVSIIGEDNDDIDVDDFEPDIKELNNETEYIHDDFDVEPTKEYICDDFDSEPQEEGTELIDDEIIKMISHEAKASTLGSTADIENDHIKSSWYDVDFAGNNASSTKAAPHTQKQSSLESKKELGGQVQKPPVLISPPSAKATLSEMGGISLSPSLKPVGLGRRRITIGQPKARLIVQRKKTTQLVPKSGDNDASESHPTFYNLRFIETPEPEIEVSNASTSEPAANPVVAQTQLHAGKSVLHKRIKIARHIAFKFKKYNKAR